MNIRIKLLAIILAFGLSSGVTNAEILIDTGSPTTTQNGAITVCGDVFTCSGGQSVALRFNLLETVTITEIQGYFYVVSPGDLTLELYRDADDVPGESLYQGHFSALDNGWAGLTELNWNVTAGSYWAAFEVLDHQTFLGAMEFPAPLILPAAVKNVFYPSWGNIGGAGGGGLIVSGVVNAVPEPETYAMFLAGLGLMGFMARRRKNRQA